MSRTVDVVAETSGWSTVVRGPRLLILRAGWAGVVALCVALYVLSIPLQVQYYQVLCRNPGACPSNQITADQLARFGQAGISLSFYAHYITAVVTLFAAVFLVVALVIFWRRSDDWMGLFTSLALVLFGVSFSGPLNALSPAYPALRPLVQLLNILAGVAITAFFYLFPDGRFVPRWTRWLLPLVVLREIVAELSPGPVANTYLFFFELASVLFVLVYRYTRASGMVQRQQTKWVVFASAAAVLGFGGLILLFGLILGGAEVPAVVNLAAITSLYCFLLLIPLSIGMAILRSHLWDIDIIIRRTLIYALLTAVLALFYGGSIIVSEGIVRAATGQERSPLATVVSTLAIAALFQPMRQRIQTGIDRRFYRGKYDAARVLGAFGAAVRDEVDLPRLADHLVAAVDEAMQPAHVSLWLTRADRQQAHKPRG